MEAFEGDTFSVLYRIGYMGARREAQRPVSSSCNNLTSWSHDLVLRNWGCVCERINNRDGGRRSCILDVLCQGLLTDWI